MLVSARRRSRRPYALPSLRWRLSGLIYLALQGEALMVNRGGFSWKRAVGITRAKQRVSRATGIPLTRSGRQRKIGKMLTGGCVVLPSLLLFSVAIVVALVLAL